MVGDMLFELLCMTKSVSLFTSYNMVVSSAPMCHPHSNRCQHSIINII